MGLLEALSYMQMFTIASEGIDLHNDSNSRIKASRLKKDGLDGRHWISLF